MADKQFSTSKSAIAKRKFREKAKLENKRRLDRHIRAENYGLADFVLEILERDKNNSHQQELILKVENMRTKMRKAPIECPDRTASASLQKLYHILKSE